MNTAKVFTALNQASTEFGKLVEQAKDKKDFASFFQCQKDNLDLIISRLSYVVELNPELKPKKEK